MMTYREVTYSEAKKDPSCSQWVCLLEAAKLAKRGKLPTTSNPPKPPTLLLPKNIMDRVSALRGTELNMVIQKLLSKTDLEKDQNRLSMPISQVKVNFLREYEEELLCTQDGTRNMKGMKVLLIEPSGDVCEATFKRWKNVKDAKRSHPWYVFNENWKEICQRQSFEIGMVVQVWSFRYDEDKLGFALVVVDTGN